jgi:hypothetical protein
LSDHLLSYDRRSVQHLYATKRQISSKNHHTVTQNT